MNDSLKGLYLKEVWAKAPWRAPRILKVTLNMGIGRNKDDKAFVEEAVKELTMIAGQKTVTRKARKSISNFKLRQGEVIGLSATLRGERMWSFLDKLVGVVLPRVRDFRGVSSKAFDGHGNYTIGVTEHSIFPEVDPNKVTKAKGLEISIVTTARSDGEAKELLTKLGFPFAKGRVS